MSYRQTVLFVLVVVFLIVNASLVNGKSPTQLQIVMVGQGQGPFLVPAGQTTELKFEILNVASMDVYLIQGDVFLDPSLNGSLVDIHSESLGNFHLNYLQSAIWTINLEMPSKIQAVNSTNSYPLVVLVVQVTYSTAIGLEESQREQFALSVPGANVGHPNTLTWVATVAVVIVLVASVLAYRAYRKTSKPR